MLSKNKTYEVNLVLQATIFVSLIYLNFAA